MQSIQRNCFSIDLMANILHRDNCPAWELTLLLYRHRVAIHGSKQKKVERHHSITLVISIGPSCTTLAQLKFWSDQRILSRVLIY